MHVLLVSSIRLVTILIKELHIFQEFKVSSFEQRLMQEIEYREGKVRLASETETEYDTDQPEEKVSATQAYAPQIHQSLKDFRLMEGSDATFVCKVTGRPRPKVR